jgi:amino acid transporter
MGWSSGFVDDPLSKWLVGLIVIVPMTWLNIRGANVVGKTSIALGVLLLGPFLVMIALGVPRLLSIGSGVAEPFVPVGTTTSSAVGTGLFVVMWNYLGWDSLSTISGEVDKPWRNFPRALALTLPIIILSYLLPTLIGLAVIPDTTRWEEGLWPEIGRVLGGQPLAIWIALTGMASATGLFAATMLGATRIPYVLARDGLLPANLTKAHPKFGTPTAAVLISAFMYTLFSYTSFENLAVVDVVLYSSAILIELAALLRLRAIEPNLPRPFRIPGGWPILGLIAILPVGIVVFSVCSHVLEEGRYVLAWSAVALALGPIFTGIAIKKRSVNRS